MKVVLTVDTEIWPFSPRWPVESMPAEKIDFSGEYGMYIEGKTNAGNFGLEYQLQVLERYELRSTWFVEPLFSERTGGAQLGDIVHQIRNRNQEIGLHLHTEWLGEMRAPGLPQSYRQLMSQFSFDEQCALIAWGRRRLLEAGAECVDVFRAGSFGANLDTIKALEALGMTQDSSFNSSVAHSFPDLASSRANAIHPFPIGTVQEFPVATFRTLRELKRNAQICACSSPELEHALLGAVAAKWEVFVIFWHSGELVRRSQPNRPYAVHVRRFHALCEFLGRHRDVMETVHFADLASLRMRDEPPLPVRVPTGPTLRRLVEQFVSRTF